MTVGGFAVADGGCSASYTTYKGMIAGQEPLCSRIGEQLREEPVRDVAFEQALEELGECGVVPNRIVDADFD